jgi:tetratricopeptide (TPR) repeat protein
MSDFDKLRLVIGILAAIWVAYKVFVRKPTTYKHYKDLVSTYDRWFRKRKSIEVLESVLKMPNELGLDEDEVSLIRFDLAGRYVKVKDYERAAKLYDEVFDVMQRDGKPWRYTPYYLTALQVFLHLGQRKHAKEIYADLLNRQSYDPRFKKIQKAEPWLDSVDLPRIKLKL